MDFSLVNICLLLIAGFGSALIQRVAGFGFSILMMTVLPYMMPSYGEAITLSGLLACITSCRVSWQLRKNVQWKKLLPMLVTFAIVSYVAVKLCASAGDATMNKCFGGMLVCISIYFYFFSSKVHIPSNIPMQVSMGGLSGILGGFFGIQGPPVVLYYLTLLKTKEEYMAVVQTYYVISTFLMTYFRWQCGFFTETVAIGWLYGFIGVFIGGWVGSMIFNRFSVNTLRKVIYLYMAISGIFALVK